MGVNRYTESGGIFTQERVSCSRKDTPLHEFEAGLKECLGEAGQLSTIKGLLDALESKAKAILELPEGRMKNKDVEESNHRRKQDAGKLLDRIAFLRKVIEEGKDYALVVAFHLGALAQRLDIRLLEPDTLRGIKTIEAAASGGHAKKDTKHESLLERNEQWQADADEIWKKYPSYSLWRVAGELESKYRNDKKLGKKRDTIYRTIKK
jgi:hypothetical protein